MRHVARRQPWNDHAVKLSGKLPTGSSCDTGELLHAHAVLGRAPQQLQWLKRGVGGAIHASNRSFRGTVGERNCGRHRDSGRQFGCRRSCTSHDCLAPTFDVRAARLDSHRAQVARGVWRQQHRQSGSQSVATSGRHSGRDSSCGWERALQQQWVGEGSAVAVVCRDGFGKPHKVATAAAGRFDPFIVVPAQRRIAQRVVMLAGAFRPGGAVDGDVQLVECVQLRGEVARQQTRQAGRYTAADDQHRITCFRLSVQGEQCADVVEVVAHRDQRRARQQKSLRELRVGRWLGEHNYVARRKIRSVVDADDIFGEVDRARVVYRDASTGRGQQRNDATTGDTATDHSDDVIDPVSAITPTSHFGGTLTSRQPPSCGGTPPFPRMRNTPAIVPASDRATRNRRSVFIANERTLACMELRIVRFTSAFDAACHFYGELLGWPVTHQWPATDGAGRGCLFGYGDTARIEFIERADDTDDLNDMVNGIFVSLEVADVVAVHDRLAEAGVPILRSLADMTWGHRSFAVHDPTGIELVHFQSISP